MVMRRKRTTTLQQDVFNLLRREGSLDSPEIARRLNDGTTKDSAQKACHYLQKRGLVKAHHVRIRMIQKDGILGGFKVSIWAAVPNCRPPKDLRGTRKSSRNNHGQRAFAKWLMMMQKKMGPTWIYKPRHSAKFEQSNPAAELCRILGY
jgi:hypothetical protein